MIDTRGYAIDPHEYVIGLRRHVRDPRLDVIDPRKNTRIFFSSLDVHRTENERKANKSNFQISLGEIQNFSQPWLRWVDAFDGINLMGNSTGCAQWDEMR